MHVKLKFILNCAYITCLSYIIFKGLSLCILIIECVTIYKACLIEMFTTDKSLLFLINEKKNKVSKIVLIWKYHYATVI